MQTTRTTAGTTRALTWGKRVLATTLTLAMATAALPAAALTALVQAGPTIAWADGTIPVSYYVHDGGNDYSSYSTETAKVNPGETVIIGTLSANGLMYVPTRYIVRRNNNTLDSHDIASDYTITIPNDAEENGDITEVQVLFDRASLDYTITWQNYDGTVLATTPAAAGDIPSYSGATPTRASTDDYAYTFAGWYKADDDDKTVLSSFPAVAGNVTYVASYEKLDRYVIRWVIANKQVVACKVTAGETPVYPYSKPVYSAGGYAYEFVGWTSEEDSETILTVLPAATGDTTYYAKFVATSDSVYSIIWHSYTNDVLYMVDNYKLDYPIPEYEPPLTANAVPDGTDEYSYKITGWKAEMDGQSIPVTGYTTKVRDVVDLADNSNTIHLYPEYMRVVNKYTVTWVDSDGETVLQLDGTSTDSDGNEVDNRVEWGQTPTWKADTVPTKLATDQYVYTFAGWVDITNGVPEEITDDLILKSLPEVTHDVTYMAYYTATLQHYTITWLNSNDTLLGTTSVAYGEVPVYPGSEPTYPETTETTYHFYLWRDYNGKEPQPVTGSATYWAYYSTEPRKYTITWVLNNGTPSFSESFSYGDIPVYDYPNPVKSPSENVTYVFAGWEPELSAVTGDAQYVAKYLESPRMYTVTWANWDGTVLATQEYEYWAVPTYDDTVLGMPTKEATIEDGNPTGWAFVGWSPTIGHITQDTTYTAMYTAFGTTATIVWLDADGNEFARDYRDGGTYDYVDNACPSGVPSKAADDGATYRFVSWALDMDRSDSDAGMFVFTPQFEAEPKIFVVQWYDEGADPEVDEPIASAEYKKDEMPYFAGTYPTKEGDEQYHYDFSGWVGENGGNVVPVVGGDTEVPVRYFATYERVLNTYTIRWCNDDGTLIYDAIYDYGVEPSYNATAPTKEATAQFTYVFAGWDHEIAPATADTTYTAIYRQGTNAYLITWQDEDGTEVASRFVQYGESPVYQGEVLSKASTEQYNYTFSGWTPTPVAVTGEATYRAVYTAAEHTYTITWADDHGNVLDQSEVTKGTVPSYPVGVPTKTGDVQYSYTFAGWAPTPVAATEDTTYTATFNATTNRYVVTWIDQDVTTSQAVEFGTVPSQDAIGMTGYRFDGWSPEVTAVTGDVTYTAQYSRNPTTVVDTANTGTGGSGSGVNTNTDNSGTNSGSGSTDNSGTSGNETETGETTSGGTTGILTGYDAPVTLNADGTPATAVAGLPENVDTSLPATNNGPTTSTTSATLPTGNVDAAAAFTNFVANAVENAPEEVADTAEQVGQVLETIAGNANPLAAAASTGTTTAAAEAAADAAVQRVSSAPAVVALLCAGVSGALFLVARHLLKEDE